MIRNHLSGWGIAILLFFVSHADAVTYTLTLFTNGPGTIGANPSLASYPSGATVTLTASPSSQFTGWSGDISGTINPTNVTMNSSLVITGNFSAEILDTITLTTNGQGTIALNPSGGTYPSNTVVTLTATPAAGWLFTSWSGDTNTSTNPLTITLTNNFNVAGNFVELPAFNLQPQTISNQVGATVTFTSQAVGTGTLYYQWYFSGNPITGATGSTLSLTNLTLANAGNYYIVATNAYGSATSATAALVLTNLPGSTNSVNICTEANLRAAIAAGGWVSINCNGSYNLTSTINITNRVILDASGFSAVVNGGGTNRLFYIAPGASLDATNLVFANGSVSNATPAFGGAIYNNAGSVSLTSCLLTNNNSSLNTGNLGAGTDTRGGAIANVSGIAYLYNCSLSNNIALGGASLAYDGIGSAAYGGAIYNTNGSLAIVHCILSGNRSSASSVDGLGSPLGSYGGAVYQASGSLTANYDLFIGNIALGTNALYPASRNGPSAGGAVSVGAGSATIYQCQFLGNTAHGGDIRLNAASGCGGAVYSAGRLAVDYSAFAGNSAMSGYGPELSPVDSKGGAIFNAGPATFNHSCIFSNLVQGSAGNDQVMGGNPVSGGNGLGGGIFNSGSLAITNCTVALNSAIAGAGGYNYNNGYSTNGNAFGGGLFNSLGATLVLMNATLANNSAIAGGYGLPPTNGFSAGDQIANTNGGYVSVRNSLLAYAGTNGNTYGTIVDGGYNFSSDGSANFSGGTSFNFTDPKLTALADNGGPTLTMALAANSPAIDYGSNAGAPSTDQRGYARPIGASVDSGAYEYGSHPLPSLYLATGLGTMQLNFSANAGYTYRLQCSSNFVTWTDIETNGPFASFTNLCRSYSTQNGPHWFYRLLVQ